MQNKILTILKNWLTFMGLEKESKLRIEKGTNSKSKIVNEQYINFHQCSSSDNFLNIQLNQQQYNTFINISKYFKFLTLSPEDKEIFLKNDEIDDKIYFSCLLLSSKYEDSNLKDARYFYPILSIPIKVFKLDGMSLKINSVNNISDYIIFKNFLVDKLSIDEDSILDGENIIEFLSKLVNVNLRDKNFLEAIEIVTKWIENRLIEVDSPFTVHKTANLPDFFVSQLDAEDYVKKIYDDLKYKKDNNNALEFVSKHSLACSYLFDTPLGNTNQPKEQIYKGVFGKHPLALGQSIVMQQVQNEEIMTAVQGAPGTGKTTLLLSIIANRITKRALALINNEDFDNLMLITSTSNKAVDNVSDAFSKDFRDYSWLYFIWGNDNKRNDSFNRLQQTISKLKNDDEIYNSIYTEKLVSEIVSISQDIDNSLKTYQLLKRKIKDTKKTIQKLKDDIAFSNRDILSNKQLVESLKIFITEDYSKLLQINNYKDSLFYDKFDTSIRILNNIQLDNEILKKIEFYEQNYMKFNKLATEFYIDEITENQELFDNLYKHTTNTISSINESSFLITIKNIFGRKNSIIRNFISSNRDFIQKCFVSFTIDNVGDILRIPGKIEYFNNNIAKIKSNLEGYDAFSFSKNAFIQFEKIYNKRINEINSALKKIESLEKSLQPLSDKLLESEDILLNATIAMEIGYKDGFLTYFKNEYHQRNLKLFELSLEYIWQIALRDKTKIIKSLEEWQYSMTTYNNDDRKSEFIKNLDVHKKNLSLVYPVITTTIASSMNLFFSPKPDIYDYLIVDEAGMITPNLLFPLISRSKKAIIVGDPKQLEPIVTLSDKEKESYKEKQWEYIESSDDKRYIEYQKYSPTMSTAYHRAAKCQTVEFDDIGDGIILDEHRRCLIDIAKIFIDIAKYNPLKIETSELQPNDMYYFAYNNFGNKSLYSYNVQIDNMIDNVNFKEIDEIEKILDLLQDAGFDLKNDVGIITPYRNQASKIVSKFKNKINHNRKLEKIGTVHKFQGAEFPVVILSTTVGKNDSITFINSKPNMLNVAVSRAKFIFIVVGNVELLKKGTYSKKMIEYICS